MGMIHFVVHDEGDSVGVVVVEGIKTGDTLEGWIMDQDRTMHATAKSDTPKGHKLAFKQLASGDTVIKICANPRTVKKMPGHVDVDTSGLLRREINMSQAGDKLLECMQRTANGRLTAAEALGHREFVLTRLYESA